MIWNQYVQEHIQYRRYTSKIFKNEIEHLVLLGVLEKANSAEWGAPSLAQPKPK